MRRKNTQHGASKTGERPLVLQSPHLITAPHRWPGTSSRLVGKQNHFKARRQSASSKPASIFSSCSYLFTRLKAAVAVLRKHECYQHESCSSSKGVPESLVTGVFSAITPATLPLTWQLSARYFLTHWVPSASPKEFILLGWGRDRVCSMWQIPTTWEMKETKHVSPGVPPITIDGYEVTVTAPRQTQSSPVPSNKPGPFSSSGK